MAIDPHETEEQKRQRVHDKLSRTYTALEKVRRAKEEFEAGNTDYAEDLLGQIQRLIDEVE
jgi:hypothetical protein